MQPSWTSFALILLLAGCAKASDYSPAIKSFASATAKAEASFADLDTAAAAQATARRRQVALANPAGVGRDGCGDGDSHCELKVTETDGAQSVLPVTSFVPRQRLAFQAIAAYAKALESVATADATEAVKSAVDQATAATAALAALTGAAAPFAPFAVPVGRLVTWLYGQYQEHIKLDALRQATGAMAPVMDDANRIFAASARAAVKLEQVQALNRFDDSIDTFRDPGKGNKEAALNDLLARREGLNAALSLKPDRVYAAMNDAHRALAAALHDDKVTLAGAVQKLQAFAAQAEELAAIAKELGKAAGKQ